MDERVLIAKLLDRQKTGAEIARHLVITGQRCAERPGVAGGPRKTRPRRIARTVSRDYRPRGEPPTSTADTLAST